MERDLDAPVDVEHGQVVDLAHLRDGEGRCESALADTSFASSWLDVNDDVDPRECVVERLLDAIGRSMALADRRAGRDADDDVCEVLASGSPQPQPPKLDRRLEPRDRLTGDPRIGLGRAVHEHVDVPARKTHRCRHDEHRHEERRDRVAGGDAERCRHQTGEHGDRPGKVAPEVERVREQRIAPVEACASQRDHRSRPVDDENEPDSPERPPGRLDVELHHARKTQDRRGGDPEADEDEKACFGESREVLRLPVTVRVTAVGRPNRDGDGEEREQGCGEVGTRMGGLGEQAEAGARQDRRRA